MQIKHLVLSVSFVFHNLHRNYAENKWKNKADKIVDRYVVYRAFIAGWLGYYYCLYLWANEFIHSTHFIDEEEENEFMTHCSTI